MEVNNSVDCGRGKEEISNGRGCQSLKRKAGKLDSEDRGPRSADVAPIVSAEFNARQVRTGAVVVHRAPLMSILKCRQVNKPFKQPCPAGWKMPRKESGLGLGSAGRRSLGMVAFHNSRSGNSRGARSSKDQTDTAGSAPITSPEVEDEEGDEDPLAMKYDPLVLWEPASGGEGLQPPPVVVERVLGKWLRDHQREGVRFLFECVAGLRGFEGKGCILADDMGLGKTLQSIALIYTALKQGIGGRPMVRRVIVVTPTSLVKNWESEFDKWLKSRIRVVALAESSRETMIKLIKRFVSGREYQVLVLSYETFRIHADRFSSPGSCDLLVCDEAHRLKNDATKTSQALNKLVCTRRILLSGTPMQNDLEEFYAMVNFTNPSLLGTLSQFRKSYQNPILIGREPGATDAEIAKSESRRIALSEIVNDFILRRTNTILSQHLPPKLTQVVFVKFSPLQREIYQHIVSSKAVQAELNNGSEDDFGALSASSRRSTGKAALSSITALKKLCNHPQLLYVPPSIYRESSSRGDKDTVRGKSPMSDIHKFFPETFGGRKGFAFSGARQNRCGVKIKTASARSWSGKIEVIANMLELLRCETNDRIVLVSNYTQTLDLFSLLCREQKYPFVRLDGSTSAKKRMLLVNRINDPNDDVFVFLLSSKAGGCGLNLVGANRLILVDPDWNPAVDKQAAARIWRDGQKKLTYIYRFLSKGAIDEKIWQRQLSKEGLQSVVADELSMESALSARDLRDLFTLKDDTLSDTHEKYKCTRCCKMKEANVLLQFGDSESSGTSETTGVSSLRQSKTPNNSRSIAPLGSSLRTCPKRSKAFKAPRRVSQHLTSSQNLKENAATIAPSFPRAPTPDAIQIGCPGDSDLNEWAHHIGSQTCGDSILRRAGTGLVSFIFSRTIDGNLLRESMKANADARAARAAKRHLALRSAELAVGDVASSGFHPTLNSAMTLFLYPGS